MSDLPPFHAVLTYDGSTVQMRCGVWSSSFKAPEIDKWIELYQWGHDRKNGKYARFYIRGLTALKAVKQRILQRQAREAAGAAA